MWKEGRGEGKRGKEEKNGRGNKISGSYFFLNPKVYRDAQSVKCLPCGPEFDLQHPGKELGMVASPCNPSSEEDAETGGSLELANQLP